MILKLSICLMILTLVTGRTVIRSKRQIEREGVQNESVVVVNKDGNKDSGVEYTVPESNDPDTDVMEVDFDKDDGSFSFGGRFPSFFSFNEHNFYSAFDKMFQQMVRRFEDMTRHMHRSFNSTQYPDNYNGTKEEVVTINGKQFIKKEHVIKKTNNHTNVFVTSVTYEPVDEKVNES